MRPIVLVHGIANPNSLGWFIRRWNIPLLGSFETFQYFRGVAAHLARNGFENVLEPTIDFAAPSAERAETLKTAVITYLGETGAEKVHLIAHSMGGLDSRRMIIDVGMADKVASLTTIGTPHLGTVLADDVIDNKGGDELIRAARALVNFDLEGGRDLRVNVCAELNQRLADDEARNDVVYKTYSSQPAKDMLVLPFSLTYKLIEDEKEGPSDGLVPVSSQKWTARIEGNGVGKTVEQKDFPIDADHLNQMGWWKHNELLNPRRRELEETVRNVYLEITQSVQHL
jgi:triacylglycerol lipase